MKNSIFICIILGLLLCGQVHSQIIPNVKNTVLSETDAVIVNKKLEKYVTFILDKKELVDNLYQNGKGSFRLNIDKERDWTIELQFNDMRSPDYVATYETEKGVFKYEDYILNTFKGNTSDGRVARFTIDKENFFGIIFNEKTHFVIRPTKDFTHNEKDESLIVYESSDLILEEIIGDYIEDAIQTQDAEKSQLRSTSDSPPIFNDCPFYLAVATDADFEFYEKYGYNLNSTYNAVFTVLNVVEGVYESTFNMRFVVTFQNVYTSSSTPYNTSNSSNLLNAFRNHWENNRTNVERHIAHLFTGKYLDGTYGGTVGLAYKGHIGDSYAYGLSQEHYCLNSITAHEIGHNFNADHVSSSNCQCGNAYNSSIMCPSVSQQHSSQLWFCDESKSQIINCMFAHRLVPICYYGVDNYGLGTALNLNGSISGVREYVSGETINSTQVITGGIIEYNAGTEITLSPGFHVQEGAVFEAKIDDISACNPINATTLNACLYIMLLNAPANTANEWEENTAPTETVTDNLFTAPIAAWLGQNVPNPAQNVSSIFYFVPENAASASIQILSVIGQDISTIPLQTKGGSAISIETAAFPKGLYLYSLVIDGKKIDTKRMIVL